MIESYFDMSYWVVDILPEQVPKESRGQYFSVEQFYLQPPQINDLHLRFINVLLKLNCYYGFMICSPDGRSYGRNLNPERLVSLLCLEQTNLCIILPDEHAMITINHDETNMTVYNPSETLRQRIAQLAGSEGLFFWRPSNVN